MYHGATMSSETEAIHFPKDRYTVGYRFGLSSVRSHTTWYRLVQEWLDIPVQFLNEPENVPKTNKLINFLR